MFPPSLESFHQLILSSGKKQKPYSKRYRLYPVTVWPSGRKGTYVRKKHGPIGHELETVLKAMEEVG